MKRGKGGLRVMGMRECTCKVGDGLGVSRGLIWPKGLSTKAPFMMLGPPFSPMGYLMALLV